MAIYIFFKKCEWSESLGHLGYDLLMASSTESAFPCPSPRITALSVISRATAGVFELEIYSSALFILICSGCLVHLSFSSRILLLISNSTGSNLANLNSAL